MVSKLIKDERLGLLRVELRRRGVVSIVAMARRIGVSQVTVRRDLDELVASGLAVRVRGGARDAESADMNKPNTGPEPDLLHGNALAERIATLLRPGHVVGVTGRRFAPMIAQALLTVADVGIVSNSLSVVGALSQRSAVPMVLLGGVVTDSGCLAGPLAVEALGRLHLDAVFIEGEGVDPAAGVTTRNLLEAETMRAFIGAAGSTFLTAAPDQWRRVSLTTIADLEAVDALVSVSPSDPGWGDNFEVIL